LTELWKKEKGAFLFEHRVVIVIVIVTVVVVVVIVVVIKTNLHQTANSSGWCYQAGW